MKERGEYNEDENAIEYEQRKNYEEKQEEDFSNWKYSDEREESE